MIISIISHKVALGFNNLQQHAITHKKHFANRFRCIFFLTASLCLLGNIALQAQEISFAETNKLETITYVPKIKKEEQKHYSIEGDTRTLQKRSLSEYNIHGRLVQYTAYEPDSTGTECIKIKKIHKYDRKGGKVGTMLYNRNNALVWSEEYKLDEKGKKSRIIQTDYEGEMPHILYIDYEYDNKGQITAAITRNAFEELQGEDKRNYNTSGELISLSSWSNTWSVEENKTLRRSLRSDYKYDKRGNLIRSETEITEGKNRWKDIRNFERNFVIEWLRYKNGELIDHFKHSKKDLQLGKEEDMELPPPIPYHAPAFEYDDDKRDPLQNIEHTPFRSISIKNNAQGLPMKEVLREAQQIISVTQFFYDEANRLIRKKKTYKQEDLTDETAYEYDVYQNLLKELTYRGEKLIGECNFQYEYYP